MPPEQSPREPIVQKITGDASGTELDEPKRRVLDFVDCFNHGRFHEAHDILEPLWRVHRQEPSGKFYQGLIQLAGAFYHVQRQRIQPALSLFRQSKLNVEFSPSMLQTPLGMSASTVIQNWTASLESAQTTSTLPPPQLRLT